MQKYDFLIVGAGVSGCVIAERLASIGKKILIIDKRDHIGGNCYDYLDNKTNIRVQKYGPHIFHTKNKTVWEYLNNFASFNTYKHKVLAKYKYNPYPIPININTINKFYNTSLKSEEEAKDFLKKKVTFVGEIKNSEDIVVSKVGKELFIAFIKGYTKKQWDKFPSELNKSVLERVSPRLNFDDFYFGDELQGMPKEGFTSMFSKIISNPLIDINLGKQYTPSLKDLAEKIIWTGRIDEFYNFKFGKLKFRKVIFNFDRIEKESFQENSVINYPESEIPFNRITEFKKFYEGPSCNETIICKETFSWDDGEIAYPIPSKETEELYLKYYDSSLQEKNVYFLGRLARYKYLNIDQCVEEALKLFEEIKLTI